MVDGCKGNHLENQEQLQRSKELSQRNGFLCIKLLKKLVIESPQME